MEDELETLAQAGEPEETSKRARLAKMMKNLGRSQEPADGQLDKSGELEEDTSKRAKIAMKMIKTMGLNQEMIRSIVTSWLVPQFKPEIIAEYDQRIAKIHDLGFLGVSTSAVEASRPFRMFDIADGVLVDDIDPSAPYCMVSHRWKDPEINLDLLRRVRKKMSKDYPTWYNTDRTDVELVLKYCKEKIMKQRKKVNGCAVKNRVDEKLAQNDCYVLSLLRIYYRSKQIRKEVKDAHAHLETMIHDKKVTDMENRVFSDLSSKTKSSIDGDGTRASLSNGEEQQPAVDDTDDDTDAIKAAYERIFDAEWERDKHSDDTRFDTLNRDLRDMVEKMVRCLRLWRSAIKIEQSILKAEKIFKRGLVPGYKQQQKFYVWLDTCCIDKSNHNEYSESLSLMGDWYAQSAFTLVHLDTASDRFPDKSDAEIYWDEYLQTDGDYHKLETIANRRIDSIQKYEDIAKEPEIEWSTRGWTLQELVMSRMTYYVNADWQLLPRPVENLGRAYHLIPHIGLYANLLDIKPTSNAWKPEILMTALLNCGAVQYTEAIKAVYPRIEQDSEEEEVEAGFSMSNALLASIAMPWNILDTVFHVAKPEPAKVEQDEKTKVRMSGEALLREISVLWDQNLASQFPQTEDEGKKKGKQKAYKINEHLRLEQEYTTTADKVSHALSIIKALELVGLHFPKDISPETAKTEIAQAVFFATMALVECYEQTKSPMVIQEVSSQENSGNKQSDSEQKAILKQKREIEKRVKLEIRKRLFQELLESFSEAKEQYYIESIENLEEKEEAIARTFAHVLHVLVDEVNTLILDDRQYIAEFGNITLLDSWVDGTRRHGFTTQEVMTLACKRRTTKLFDRAYSLMGILGVRFPTFPAEGYEKALCRLFDETVTTRNDVSVFNWAGYNKGSSIRGRSMYPSTQEAYQAKDSRLYSRNSMAETEKDKMLQTTSYYHAIVSLLRDLIEFLKKDVPPKQMVEWIGNISAIIHSFDLEKLKAAPASAERLEKLSGRSNISNGTGALPYEIEVLSKFIGFIINGPSQARPGPKRLLSSRVIRNPRFEVDINPDVQIVVEPPAQTPDINHAQIGRDSSSSNDQNAFDTEDTTPPELVDVPTPIEGGENESPLLSRKSRFVEQLSDAGSIRPPPMTGENETSQTESNIPLSENEEISRYLQNWATNSLQWIKKDSHFFENPLPAKIQDIRHKIEKEHRENSNYKTASFGSPNMVSPHPIIVTNAGIESIFDIQRVIITMADLQGLRQQVEHATSPDQIISGYCSISTGFAQVIVQFSCKSEMLRKQLEVNDGIDFRVMKEQNKKEDKKREHKMTSKVLFEKKKKDKKGRDEKKKKKDKRGDAESIQSMNLDEANDEGANDASEEPQTRDLDEEKTINRMIKFIQEDDLRLVAGEWVLARCSGVANADWFLCHLEIGSTHPFYGYRIPTSEIDFNNCFPEDGLVAEWNRYMNRKKEEMCKILATYLKSKEHKLKRRRLVGRIIRDLAPLDEKAEDEVQGTSRQGTPRQGTPRSSFERNETNGFEMNGANGLERSETREEQANPIQHEYDYMDDFAEERNEYVPYAVGQEPLSVIYSQESASSVQHDDVWSAVPDPTQYSTTSVQEPDRWGNQELRPEDSVSNYGDRPTKPSQEVPTPSFDDMTVVGRNEVIEQAAEAEAEAEADEKSKIWDYLPLIEKVAEKTAKHYDKHLSATVLKDTPTVLRQAIENLNDNRDFLPAMFHSAKKIHMF